MANKTIPKSKQVAIQKLVVNGIINIKKTARKLRLSRNTLKRYIRKYSALACGLDNSEQNNYFGIQACEKSIVRSYRYMRLMELLPFLANIGANRFVSVKEIWQQYQALCPDGYKRSTFNLHFSHYLNSSNIKRRKIGQIDTVSQEDLRIIKNWRKSSDRRKWEKAVAILDSLRYRSTGEIAIKIERSKDKVSDWIRAYKCSGIQSLERKARIPNLQQVSNIKDKRDNLVRLLHESPRLYGINRTSWFLSDLSTTFKKIYGINVSTSTISTYLKKEGFVYRKAKEVLTSPDPEFREKMDHIKNILTNLGEKEKFFSVDEFGPFAVKMKGGKSLVKKGERKTFPQIQKSKGFTICTAALELSQNQVTHFFSQKKDTEEIIKLIELLLIKYQSEDKLYFSWDAASWHASKKLYVYLDRINSADYRSKHKTPVVLLAPLPASAQFLNVIESVFSGLAKSIIHNSNYDSLDQCKEAVSQYFKTRNEHFLQHPQKAGNRIWGKEIVAPTFNDCNNCKDPKFR